jgi:hypothetical protein
MSRYARIRDDQTGTIDGALCGDKSSRSPRLLGIVLHQDSYEDVGVDALDLRAARLRIAASISSSATVRVGLHRDRMQHRAVEPMDWGRRARGLNSFMGVHFGDSLDKVERRDPKGSPRTSPYGAPAYILEDVNSGSIDDQDAVYEFSEKSRPTIAFRRRPSRPQVRAPSMSASVRSKPGHEAAALALPIMPEPPLR